MKPRISTTKKEKISGEQIRGIISIQISSMVNVPALFTLIVTRGISEQAAGIFLLCYGIYGIGNIINILIMDVRKKKTKWYKFKIR